MSAFWMWMRMPRWIELVNAPARYIYPAGTSSKDALTKRFGQIGDYCVSSYGHNALYINESYCVRRKNHA